MRQVKGKKKKKFQEVYISGIYARRNASERVGGSTSVPPRMYFIRNCTSRDRELESSGAWTILDINLKCRPKCNLLLTSVYSFWRPCQHDDGYLDGRSQIKVHTDERTRVHSARSSLTVTHPSMYTEVDVAVLQWTCHWASLGRHRQP